MNLYANHYVCSKCNLPCAPWSRQPLTFGVPVPILSACCQTTVRVIRRGIADDASMTRQSIEGERSVTTTANRVAYEVVASENAVDEYRVEGIDYSREGIVYVAVFSGPDAEQRAREYALFKNSQPQVR